MIDMIDVILFLVILAIIVPVVIYLVKAKKKGQVCIGCPNAPKCGGNCHHHSSNGI